MKIFYRIPAILIVGVAALAAGQESTAVQSAHVTARLVMEDAGIVPGRPFTLGLRLEMEKGWHTYTDPAGDAGVPTKITWTLPEGFKAGEIQWPEAHDFNLGPLKTRGYDGTIVLPVTITPPDALEPGQTVRIAAKAEWLACEVTCVPGSVDSRWKSRSCWALHLAARAFGRVKTLWDAESTSLAERDSGTGTCVPSCKICPMSGLRS